MFKKLIESGVKAPDKKTLLALTLFLIVFVLISSFFLVDLTNKDGISTKVKYGDEIIHSYTKCIWDGSQTIKDNDKITQAYNNCLIEMKTKHKKMTENSKITRKQKLMLTLYTALSNTVPSLIVLMALFWMRLYRFKKSFFIISGTFLFGVTLQYFCLWMINGIGFTSNPVKEYIVFNTVCIAIIGTLLIGFMDETINTLFKHPIMVNRFPLGENNLRLIQLSKCQEAMNLQHIDFIKLVALGNGNEYAIFLDKIKFINKQIRIMSELNSTKSNNYLEKSISEWKELLSKLNNPKSILNDSIYDIGVKLNNDIYFIKDELDKK